VALCLPKPTPIEGTDVSTPPSPTFNRFCHSVFSSILCTIDRHLASQLTASTAILIQSSTSQKTLPGPLPQSKPPPTVLSEQPTRPNSCLHYAVYTKHYLRTPAGPLSLQRWRERTTLYPEPSVTDAILGICRFGARIGYEGRRDRSEIYPNLSSATDFPEVVTKNIMEEIVKNRLECYPTLASVPEAFTASSLGLVDKSDSS